MSKKVLTLLSYITKNMTAATRTFGIQLLHDEPQARHCSLGIQTWQIENLLELNYGFNSPHLY